MGPFCVDKHQLVFSTDYRELTVYKDDNVEDTFDLTDVNPPLKLWVEDNEYHLERGTKGKVLAKQTINEASGETADVNSKILIGVGTIDLRDTGRSDTTVKYHLDSVKVVLEHNNQDQYGFTILLEDTGLLEVNFS